MNTRKLKKFLRSQGWAPGSGMYDGDQVVTIPTDPQGAIVLAQLMADYEDTRGFNIQWVVGRVYFPDFPWEDDLPADKPEFAATATFAVIYHVNWSLLARQKDELRKLDNCHVLAGLENLIHRIQHAAVIDGIAEEREVFK